MNRPQGKNTIRPYAWLPAVFFVAGCATAPVPKIEPEITATKEAPRIEVQVDETAMLPLLGYLQLLPGMSAQERARERKMLSALPQTPNVCLRTAMLLGQTRTFANLARAQALLASILKSNEVAANSLHPLARLLSTHYSERQRLEQQNARLTTQVGEAEERLNGSQRQSDELQRQNDDLQRRNDELQRTIDALADIERSLHKPPTASDSPPKNTR